MKNAYVLIEGLKGTKVKRGCDSWLCPWDDFLSVVENMMDNDHVATIRITDFSFTEEELEAYCRENEIDWNES